jgi:hypothetical protein
MAVEKAFHLPAGPFQNAIRRGEPMPATEGSGYVVCVYAHPALPPERKAFSDLPKAEKAYLAAKAKTILFQTREPGQGLGWIKLKEKDAAAPSAEAGSDK